MAPPIPPGPMPTHATFLNDPTVVIMELAFTVIAVAFCFAIYLRTKEAYDLTKYKGINYFRHAFLFFGISYILSFLSSIVIFSRIIFGMTLPREIFFPILILPLGYLSTMAILYLIYSSIWKNFESRKAIMISHLTAIVLTLVAFATRSHLILLYLQSILFILAIVLGILTSSKKMTQTRILYFFVLGLWLVNLLVIGKGRPMNPVLDLLLLATSICAYIFIYKKITKWTN